MSLLPIVHSWLSPHLHETVPNALFRLQWLLTPMAHFLSALNRMYVVLDASFGIYAQFSFFDQAAVGTSLLAEVDTTSTDGSIVSLLTRLIFGFQLAQPYLATIQHRRFDVGHVNIGPYIITKNFAISHSLRLI